MTRFTHRRSAFTLVELLVAVALSIAILAVAVGLTQTGAFDSYKIVGGADKLSQMMIQAKNRALRDKLPRGVRLQIDGDEFTRTGQLFAKEMSFVEVPEPWLPLKDMQLRVIYCDPGATGTPTATPQKRFFITWPMASSYGTEFDTTTMNADARVRNDDLLGIPSLGVALRITTIRNPISDTVSMAGLVVPTGRVGVELVINDSDKPNLGSGYSVKPSAATDPWPATLSLDERSFFVTRSARPLLGEPPVQMPAGVAVDLTQFILDPTMDVMPPMSTQRLMTNPMPPPMFKLRSITNALAPPYIKGTGSNMFADVLFTRSGEVISTGGASSNVICLPVRDVGSVPEIVDLYAATDYTGQATIPAVNGAGGKTAAPTPVKSFPATGQVILVVVYPKTGAIATQQVNGGTADPHQFAKDGINTGL